MAQRFSINAPSAKNCRVRAALQNWQQKGERWRRERETERDIEGQKGKATLEQWRAKICCQLLWGKGKSDNYVCTCRCLYECLAVRICKCVWLCMCVPMYVYVLICSRRVALRHLSRSKFKVFKNVTRFS